jgi:sugar/nucleoside kinase (ribokinase family)
MWLRLTRVSAGTHQQYVDIVFANEEEAKAFTGKEPEEALDE